jgi:hypothetical protein
MANLSSHSLMQSLSDIFADDEETLEIFTASLRRDAADESVTHKQAFCWQESCHSFYGNGDGDDLLNLNAEVSHASFNDSFDKKTYLSHVNTRKPQSDDADVNKKRHIKMAMYADLNKNMTSPRQVIPRFVLRKDDSRMGGSMLTVGSSDTSASGKSIVLFSCTSECSESESNDCAPRKPIRGDVNKAIGLLKGAEKVADNGAKKSESKDIAMVTPVRRRTKSNLDLHGLPDASFSLVSPASSTTSDSSSSEAVVIAPTLRHRRLEMLDSCPLVSGEKILQKAGLIRSDSISSDAAPKRPSRSRSPPPSTPSEAEEAPRNGVKRERTVPLSEVATQDSARDNRRGRPNLCMTGGASALSTTPPYTSESQRSCRKLAGLVSERSSHGPNSRGVPPLGPRRQPSRSIVSKTSASCRNLHAPTSESKDLTPVVPRRNRGSITSAASCRQVDWTGSSDRMIRRQKSSMRQPVNGGKGHFRPLASNIEEAIAISMSVRAEL